MRGLGTTRLILLGLALALAGCAPKREELAIYHESSSTAAGIAARLEAIDKGGQQYLVANTGSMEPTLHGGDYIVGIPTAFSDLKVGMICTYKAEWNPLPSTCHRIVATWPSGGFVMEGDGQKNTAETKWTMDAAHYQFHIISSHRFP